MAWQPSAEGGLRISGSRRSRGHREMGIQQGTKFQERKIGRSARARRSARLGENAEGEAKMGGGVTGGRKKSGTRPGIRP
jgi:hypothetical protein